MGLCVYLWNINTSVAVPVVVVTTLATCIYGLATILPMVWEFCPYNTPATSLVRWVVTPLLEPLAKLFGSLLHTLKMLRRRIEGPLGLAVYRIEEALRNFSSHTDITEPAVDDETIAPMDLVTCQMLVWLVVNCEDSRSVDITLQAIAGATDDLPRALLWENKVVDILYARLSACTGQDPSTKWYKVNSVSMIPAALRYCQAFRIFASDYHDHLRRLDDEKSDSGNIHEVLRRLLWIIQMPRGFVHVLGA